MRIKIYGSRGSNAVSRPLSFYGGNSSCAKIDSGDEFIVVDGKLSGIVQPHRVVVLYN